MADVWDTFISRFTPQRPASSGQYGGSSGTVDADYVIKGLVARGLPEHVAEGFAMNIADESSFNPGIVGDAGAALGLVQWNGPRKRALQNFAAQNGANATDPELQLDFLMHELNGPENGAFKAILRTSTAGEAAAAIVNKFERPAEVHRARREAKYLGGGGAPTRTAEAPTFNRLWLDLGA